MEIWEKYLSKLDKQRRSLVLRVLNLAERFTPEAEEAMPYGVPGLKFKGKNLIAAAVHKNHLGIYPFSPKIVKEISKLMANPDTAEGTIRFSLDDFPPESLIKQIIELRKEEIISTS